VLPYVVEASRWAESPVQEVLPKCIHRVIVAGFRRYVWIRISQTYHSNINNDRINKIFRTLESKSKMLPYLLNSLFLLT